jgi:hypothetical protein
MNLIDLINRLTVVIVENSIRNPYWNPHGGWGKEGKIVVFVSKIDPNFPSRLLLWSITSSEEQLFYTPIALATLISFFTDADNVFSNDSTAPVNVFSND